IFSGLFFSELDSCLWVSIRGSNVLAKISGSFAGQTGDNRLTGNGGMKQCWQQKSSMKTILAGICAVLGVLNCAQAWNAEGHMVTAQIAYDHLTPAARAACNTLIAVPLANNSPGTSNFVTAAVWADDFKTPLGTAIWHFIDIPFSLDGTPTNGVGAAAFDVVQAIHLC